MPLEHQRGSVLSVISSKRSKCWSENKTFFSVEFTLYGFKWHNKINIDSEDTVVFHSLKCVDVMSVYSYILF